MKIGNRQFDFKNQSYVMGILNTTPDSFSDGGRYLDPEKALDQVLRLQEEGADLIDVGGESTRPGSEPISTREELSRVVPVLQKIGSRLKIPLSIDTQKSEVASIALDLGVSLVNDVSALSDPEMISVLIQWQIPVVLMHKKGEPKNMQENVHYEDVVQEVIDYLNSKISFAVENGVLKENILIDPGIGFGKRFNDNQALLNRLGEFLHLQCPIVFGASRKRFVRDLFGENPGDIEWGSVLVAMSAAQKGASLVRVHDVRKTKQALQLL